MNRARLLRLGGVGFVFLGVSALFGVYFFDPAAPRFWSEFAVWVAVGLSAGLVATSWWSLLLAVPAGIAVYQHVALEAAFFAAAIASLATVLLLCAGTAIGKRSHHGRRVGASLLAACVLIVLFGVFRQVRPYNATPLAAVPFDLDLGSADGVHIDESVEDVRERFGRPDWEEVGVLSWQGLTVRHTDGFVLVVEVEDERFQTVDGVGVGDSIAYAKRRWPGLLCGRDGFREAYCAGLAGPRLLLIEGNPIRSIAVSGDLCWPDVSGLTPNAGSCAETVRELRQVKG